jgi:multisubunit Na+/H+ antiporter MnhC subunit
VTTLELGAVILVCSILVVGVATTAFVFFSRFMKNEQARSERFREIHGTKKRNEE